MKLKRKLLLLFAISFGFLNGLREFRSFSIRTPCENAKDPNYPFAYSKYDGQASESKGRVNSNLQDFRHECFELGGKSKCHICEDVECSSDTGVCHLQLQGVDRSEMSINVPVVSDTSWAVGGSFYHDYGGAGVTHYCVFTSGGKCIDPETEDFSGCAVRCFGHGFNKPPQNRTEVFRRTITDLYPGMGRWPDDGQVDSWQYPKNCDEYNSFADDACTYSGANNVVPSFNPQGFAFTFSGSGIHGFEDGTKEEAKFNGPEDVALDFEGDLFVADTQNNAIRRVKANGDVITIAGKGPMNAGYKDGDCTQATFALPKGLDVINSKGVTIILVADTGNHRIRRIDYNKVTGACKVRCLTGLCGNNSLSATDFSHPAAPLTGYADGSGLEARFSAPESVAFMKDGKHFVVADSGNFLIRWVVTANGTTETLAGNIVHGEVDPDGKPLAGCTPPCMVGQQGFRDGNLTYAQFYNPIDVTRGPNNTVWVTDEQRIRIIELPSVKTEIWTIKSMGRVSTIAGSYDKGHDDGIADMSNFYSPSGIFVTKDNIAYVADSATCRIRRITPMQLVAQSITCTTRAVDIIRPSGCTSFDQPTDAVGRKVSRVEANIQYNYGWPYMNDKDKGKFIKNCVGVPPHDRLDKHFLSIDGDNLVVDDHRTVINEDSEQGTSILVYCPASCLASSANATLEGTEWYSEESSVCKAAIHSGYLKSTGGYVQITLERKDFLQEYYNASRYYFINGSTHYGVTSTDIPDEVYRVFNMIPYNISNSFVHTVAGAPSAPLQDTCGFRDAQPATLAMFNNPSGVTASYSTNLASGIFLYIADTKNNRIRGLSATCTQICENGGVCVGPDTCQCPTGWTGIDCTKPICSVTCGDNKLCVAPNTCGCKPGFGGTNCATPQCNQKCHNGGTCIAPDTCGCTAGWFDSNCTTPVCSQTCANGGNCTSPDICACPSDWGGHDCRIPQCNQVCLNGGYCVAPNTCQCPPQYTNYDCSAPVCTQGYFVADMALSVPTYKNCDLQSWCNATNEFECDQQNIKYGIIRVPSGGIYRAITGRKDIPKACMKIELPTDFKLPFQLLFSDNGTTGHVRFSPFSPYTSNPQNSWRGYLEPTEGHTGPWEYDEDRQVAYVNWLNATQGHYVCANGGTCTSPGICACAPGWIGFDCRTPVCEQGYYKDTYTDFTSSDLASPDLDRFKPFMSFNPTYMNFPYSNPDFTIEYEYYINASYVIRKNFFFDGERYARNDEDNNGLQGGYRCTIRADTQWENEYTVFQHPNYYSLYMDKALQEDGKFYTNWTGMSWPPLHNKSRVLDQAHFGYSFAYTNEGWRRYGVWTKTGEDWKLGLCYIQFYRNCSENRKKQYDLESDSYSVYVQDTDLSFRPRMFYGDRRVIGKGRWKQSDGECVDEVIRGCANNGTCYAPNKCRCAKGWRGDDCRIPVCDQDCKHNGNCTNPNVCTCERGWTGYDCSIPMCAQECQNGGKCVAPDTCQCKQWPNTFRDGRVAGGQPLFQDLNGDPLNSGWTGYDCSVPICVQAESFILNVPSATTSGFVTMGGHGGDGLLTCTDSVTGKTLPRCPQYDLYVTGNDGKSFQTGCGWDPFDTGCCIKEKGSPMISCYTCPVDNRVITDHAFYCSSEMKKTTDYIESTDLLKDFLDPNKNFYICGNYSSPLYHDPDVSPQDYGVAKFYYNVLFPEQSSFNYLSNWTSNRFLCNVNEWTQGDYIDDAGLGKIVGAGSIWGLDSGRHIRINTPGIADGKANKTRGEGVYVCYNSGSCIGPDTCTCNDGYEGYDCKTPLCRHLQPSGAVTSCLNGGICIKKDFCNCVQTSSVLYIEHPHASHGITGWTGTDCSTPICVQGYYDPFCTDLPQAPGGEGCFRCANNGNCTAPDVCTCAPGWTGFDCRTPVCEVVADPLTRTQLGTFFENKVIEFESDPCGVVPIYGMHGWHGTKYSRGNCTQPNQCTCLCKNPYSKKACDKTGKLCDGPWQDQMVQLRNLLTVRGPEFTFGSTDCEFGYEDVERRSISVIVAVSVVGFVCFFIYRYAAARIRKRFLLAKIERRRSKRSSEESLLSAGSGAFVNQ